MRKQTWLLVSLILILAALLAAGGTLAYFTGAKQQVRTYAVSGIDISMTENFEEGMLLLTGKENAVEKQLSITLANGSADAYVWYEYCLPAASQGLVHVEGKQPDWVHAGLVCTEEVDGVQYNVYLVLHEAALKGGQTTLPDEVDIYLDGANGDVRDADLTLRVRGYAMQAKHLADADEDGDVDVYDAYALYHAQQAK